MAGEVLKWELAYEDSAENSEGPERKYSETYIATLKNKNTNPFYIFKYRYCPKPGDRHTVDKAAYVSRVKPKRIGSSSIWKVVIDYTTNISAADNTPNPLKRPAVITVETRVEVVPTLFEADGRLRINPVGDLVPGKKKKAFQTFTVRKNVANIPDWFHTMPGSTNKYDFQMDGRNRPERTLQLLNAPKPERRLENSVWYYPLEIKIEQDVDTYDVPEPATSFHELVQTGFIESKKPGVFIPEYTKKRIMVGTPKEYAKDKQFIDKEGHPVRLQGDLKKGGIDINKIYVQYRRDLTETDYSVLQPVVT